MCLLSYLEFPCYENFRAVETLLNEIGMPSDLAPLHENLLFHDQHCITARVRVNVNDRAVDRIQILTMAQRHLTVYVHYEKIHRICTYCARFFHNVNLCPERNEALIQQKLQGEDKPVHFVRYGAWMNQISAVPREAMETHDSQTTNPLLQQFQEHFGRENVDSEQIQALTNQAQIQSKQGQEQNMRKATEAGQQGSRQQTRIQQMKIQKAWRLS
jgi:hypothetical protein